MYPVLPVYVERNFYSSNKVEQAKKEGSDGAPEWGFVFPEEVFLRKKEPGQARKNDSATTKTHGTGKVFPRLSSGEEERAIAGSSEGIFSAFHYRERSTLVSPTTDQRE